MCMAYSILCRQAVARCLSLCTMRRRDIYLLTLMIVTHFPLQRRILLFFLVVFTPKKIHHNAI